MSTDVTTAAPPTDADRPRAGLTRTGRAPTPWTWMVLACGLLGASGGTRWWQEHHIAGAAGPEDAVTFPMKSLPRTVGDWQVQGEGEAILDPEIAQIAGCKDYMLRTYVNRATGVSVTALVIYGRAATVFAHTPEVCYPSAGYVPVEASGMHPIPSGRGPALFRSGVFAKEVGMTFEREEVYYAFRHDGRWFPDALAAYKQFRRHPWMFKVQAQRRVSASEHLDIDNPTEQFLAVLLPEFERRLAAARTGGEG